MRLWVIGMLLAAVVGCTSNEENQARESASDAILRSELIMLDEDEESLIVEPRVRIDPEGGFLVADVREAQVRRYDPSGRLLWRSGRRGDGPGEYRSPVSVARLPGGAIVVLDRSNVVTLLSGEGDYLDSFSVPFARVSGLVVVDENLVLIRGLTNDGPELLHYLNLTTRSIEGAFLPAADIGDPSLSRSLAYATADVLNDKIAAAHGPLDSVYIFDRNGHRLGGFRVPVKNYRIAMPSPTRNQGPEGRAEWESTYESMSGIWWVNPDLLAVGYKTLLPDGIDWHWVLVTTAGELVHQEVGSVELLAADPRASVVVTVAPNSESPSGWQRLTVHFER